MAIGPGIYDDLCEAAIVKTKAEAVVLMVINGKRGHGFSVNSTDPLFVIRLPELLRQMADSLDQENSQTKPEK